jgi:hypothetical protein
MRLGRAALVWVAVLAIPCWPALVNGQPFFTLDTVAYLRAAAQGTYRLLGIESVWYAPPVAVGASELGQALPGSPQPHPPAPGFGVLMARSVYYGLFLLASHPFSQLWLAVLAQSAVVATAVLLTLRSFSTVTIGYSIASLAVLSTFTPMAFFVSMLMPDILASIAILACAHLITRFDRLERWELMFWVGALCYSMLAHFSHLLIVAALAAVATVRVASSANKARWLACGALAAALAVAFLGERAFSQAIERMTGAPPIRPPFLMARMIEDGPGYRYLQATCPGNGLEVCAYLDRLPVSAEDFVWDGREGPFGAADMPTRRALSAEQVRFAWNVLRFDFVGQASASLANWMRQLTTFSQLTDFSYGYNMRQAFASVLPEPYRTRLQTTPAARDALPLQVASLVFQLAAFASALALVYVFAAYRNVSMMEGVVFWEFAGLVIAGVMLNAAVCGVLAGIFDRYQARVVWLVPMLALVGGLKLHSAQQCRGAAER